MLNHGNNLCFILSTGYFYLPMSNPTKFCLLRYSFGTCSISRVRVDLKGANFVGAMQWIAGATTKFAACASSDVVVSTNDDYISIRNRRNFSKHLILICKWIFALNSSLQKFFSKSSTSFFIKLRRLIALKCLFNNIFFYSRFRNLIGPTVCPWSTLKSIMFTTKTFYCITFLNMISDKYK